MKRVFIDLEKCDRCKACRVGLGQIFHPQGNTVTSIRELAIFSTICRRCEDAPCIASCYRNALTKDENGIIQRGRFLCTGCKTCSIACPFGVILPDFLTYIDEVCRHILTKNTIATLSACPEHALTLKEIDEDNIADGVYVVSDSLAVSYRKWFKDDAVLFKKR